MLQRLTFFQRFFQIIDNLLLSNITWGCDMLVLLYYSILFYYMNYFIVVLFYRLILSFDIINPLILLHNLIIIIYKSKQLRFLNILKFNFVNLSIFICIFDRFIRYRIRLLVLYLFIILLRVMNLDESVYMWIYLILILNLLLFLFYSILYLLFASYFMLGLF